MLSGPIRALILLSLCAIAAEASAAPWKSPFRGKRVDADPVKEYALREENGPWMIFAAAFGGETAMEEARQLVLELRRELRLPAYTHVKRFDYNDEVIGNGFDKYGRPRKMQYRMKGEFDEVGVLVGDFASVDDPSIEKTLAKIKVFQPECLKIEAGKGTSLRFGGLRHWQKKFNLDPEKRNRGPLRQVFVTRNPLLPEEYFVPRGIDKVVLKSNEGVEHSLLDCPGKFTVRIATFRGEMIIDQQDIAEIEEGKEEMKSRLAAATLKAHKLTTALRKQGVEAYEFHDRYESYVTVGSYDSVGQYTPDGRAFKLYPEVTKIIETYGPQKRERAVGNSKEVAFIPKKIAGVQCDISPEPVEVPRHSLVADSSRRKEKLR